MRPVTRKPPSHGLGPASSHPAGARRDALAERLAVDRAVLDDAAEQLVRRRSWVARASLVEVEQVGDLPGPQHRRVVHVERERRRPAVPADLRGDPRVVGEARAEAAVALRHAQREEAHLAQVGEVLEREGRLEVVLHGALGEHGAERADLGDERVAVDGGCGSGRGESHAQECSAPAQGQVNTVDFASGQPASAVGTVTHMPTAPLDHDAPPARPAHRGDRPARAVPARPRRRRRTAWEPQLAACADVPPLRRLGHARLRRRRPRSRRALVRARSADAVGRLLDAARPEAAHVVGLSMGGQIALHTALRHPAVVRSLALLDSSPAFGLDGTDPEAWKRAAARRARRRRRRPASMARAGAAVDHGAGRRADAARGRGGRVDVAHPGRRRCARRSSCLSTHDVRERLGEIAVPTLVLVGEHDEETPPAYAEALAGRHRRARTLEIIPGAGHISQPRGARAP